MSERQNVTVLGATGTIGLNTLDVIARHRRGEELPGRVDRARGY